MAKKHPLIEEKLKRAIRDAMAIDPLISRQGLIEYLEKRFGHHYDHRYINKLCEKVLRQARAEVDRTKLNQRLTQLKETHRIARERLIKIIYWSSETALSDIKPPQPRDLVEACKTLVMLDLAVLSAELANGIYQSKELDEKNRAKPMSVEQRKATIEAFQRWGLLPTELTSKV